MLIARRSRCCESIIVFRVNRLQTNRRIEQEKLFRFSELLELFSTFELTLKRIFLFVRIIMKKISYEISKNAFSTQLSLKDIW